MSTTNPFAGLFPGFDFMQQAVSGVPAGGSLPGLGSWIPTLDAKELDNRINELKTVLFWLEQNAAIVKSTMQALEVQKMTLGTLGAMNLGMAEMAKAFTMPPPAPVKGGAAPVPGAWPFATSVSGAVPPADDKPSRDKGAAPEGGKAQPDAAQQMAASMVAPAQMWWNALSAQFQQLAGTVEQQQVAVEAATAAAKAQTAATAKAAAEVAEAAAEVAEAAAEVAEAAAAVQEAKPKNRAASSKADAGGKDEDKGKSE